MNLLDILKYQTDLVRGFEQKFSVMRAQLMSAQSKLETVENAKRRLLLKAKLDWSENGLRFDDEYVQAFLHEVDPDEYYATLKFLKNPGGDVIKITTPDKEVCGGVDGNPMEVPRKVEK